MDFAQIRQEYDRLAAQLAQGQIERQAFLAALGALRTQGPDGRWWTVDANTGGWLVWQNNAWEPGQPPVAAPPKPPPPPPPVVRPPAPARPPTPVAGPPSAPTPTAPPPAARPPAAPPGPPPAPAASAPPAPPPAARPPAPPPAAAPPALPPDDLPEELPEDLPEELPEPMPELTPEPTPEPASEMATAPEPVEEQAALAEPPEAETPVEMPAPEGLSPLERIQRCLDPDEPASEAEAQALLGELRGAPTEPAIAAAEARLDEDIAALRRALRAVPLIDDDTPPGEIAPGYLAGALAALADMAPLGDMELVDELAPSEAVLRLAQLVALGAAPASARIAPREPVEGPLAALTAQAQRQMSDAQMWEAALAGHYGPWLRGLAEQVGETDAPEHPLCSAGELAADALAELAEELIRMLNIADAESASPRAPWFQ